MNVSHHRLSYVHRGAETALLGTTIWNAFEKMVATHPLCAGSGRLRMLRLMHKVLGENVVMGLYDSDSDLSLQSDPVVVVVHHDG